MKKYTTLQFNGSDFEKEGKTECPECGNLTWVGKNEDGDYWMCQKCWFKELNKL